MKLDLLDAPLKLDAPPKNNPIELEAGDPDLIKRIEELIDEN